MGYPVRKIDANDLRSELRTFETAHGMTSSTFYDRFRAGELGDAPEFIQWAGLCYAAQRIGILTHEPERV